MAFFKCANICSGENVCGDSSKQKMKVHPREDLNVLLPETWEQYKIETPLKQVQSLCFPGSLSLVYLSSIFFRSALCLAVYQGKFVCVSFPLALHAVFRASWMSLPCHAPELWEWWGIPVLVSFSSDGVDLGEFPLTVRQHLFYGFSPTMAQWGHRPQPEFARLKDGYPKDRSSVSTLIYHLLLWI